MKTIIIRAPGAEELTIKALKGWVMDVIDPSETISFAQTFTDLGSNEFSFEIPPIIYPCEDVYGNVMKNESELLDLIKEVTACCYKQSKIVMVWLGSALNGRKTIS